MIEHGTSAQSTNSTTEDVRVGLAAMAQTEGKYRFLSSFANFQIHFQYPFLNVSHCNRGTCVA
jgi:hypothetical protein